MNRKFENDLKEMLAIAGLTQKPSYSPGEVQIILGISEREFHRLVNRYEPDHETGSPRNPCSLDSFMLRRSRRVRFDELVKFLHRNNTYERTCG